MDQMSIYEPHKAFPGIDLYHSTIVWSQKHQYCRFKFLEMYSSTGKLKKVGYRLPHAIFCFLKMVMGGVKCKGSQKRQFFSQQFIPWRMQDRERMPWVNTVSTRQRQCYPLHSSATHPISKKHHSYFLHTPLLMLVLRALKYQSVFLHIYCKFT